MPRPLSEQVVVVAGASSGMGRVAARMFAGRGASVVVSARTGEALDSLVREITDAGGVAYAVPADFADAEQAQRVADATLERFGRIDTWANVLGITVYGRVGEITLEEFRQVIDTNLFGHVHGVYAALPALRAHGGVIIGVSSVLGVSAIPLQAPYVASKFALNGFYDSLRMELQHDGVPIAVTTVLPASIDTPLFEHARSKTGQQPRPVPPVYAPEVAAKAIVRAAEHPTREVVVGGSGQAIVLSKRLMPGLSDRVTALIGMRAQLMPEPDDGVDNVDRPAGDDRASGAWSGHVSRTSVVTTLLSANPIPARIGALAGTAYAARRLLRRG